MNSNMKSPKVSVIMSTYNGAKFIRESIESILNQTFTDFEFLIRNDSSTDNTEEIITSFNDPRIVYIKHEREILGKALGDTCKLARGKYIARMDDDDISFPDRLQKEYDFLESNQEYVLVASPVIVIDEFGNEKRRTFRCTKSDLIKGASYIYHPTVMFRKEAYMKSPGYPHTRRLEDHFLWKKLGKYGEFYLFEEPLVKYRRTVGSLSNNRDESSPYFKMYEIMTKQIDSSDEFDDKEIDLFNRISSMVPLAPQNKSLVSKKLYSARNENRLYNIIKTLFGERIAMNILVFIRNYHCYKLTTKK